MSVRTIPPPRTISGSDYDRALAHADGSPSAPALRRGDRPVVLGQARHLPPEVLELLLQGCDLLAVPPLFPSRIARTPPL